MREIVNAHETFQIIYVKKKMIKIILIFNWPLFVKKMNELFIK